MKLQAGKLNPLIDGQFGSTGKGLVATYIASTEHIDISVTSNGPNSGHTGWINGKEVVVKMLPISSIVQPRNTIYFCSGAVIDPYILKKEIEQYNIDISRILINGRCAVVDEYDRVTERDSDSSVTKIASTQSGCGSAIVRKVQRSAVLAQGHPDLREFKKTNHNWLCEMLEDGCTALMEVPQGFDLSLSSGYSYPYCTSREVTVSAAMADAQLHPHYLGKVTVVIRTYPIRVGNIVENGEEIGNSGPFWADSTETSWKELNLGVELTTVTGRIRRVASFSLHQYHNMLKALRPDYVVLNFCNYMDDENLKVLLEQLPEVSHVAFGPEVKDVKLNHILS